MFYSMNTCNIQQWAREDLWRKTERGKWCNYAMISKIKDTMKEKWTGTSAVPLKKWVTECGAKNS